MVKKLGAGYATVRRLGNKKHISKLIPLSNGRVAVATLDPMLGILDESGRAQWSHSAASSSRGLQ